MTITIPELATGATGWTDEINQFFADIGARLDGLSPLDALQVTADIIVGGTVDTVDIAAAYALLLAHAARHEDGGADEINVGGLTGLLATEQTAAPHAIGSGSHTASTIALLNSKISDGNVDKDTAERVPKLHAAVHMSAGADALRLDELKAPTDVATLNSSAAAHGLLKKLPNVAAQFINGVGNWAVPAGGGMNFVDRGDPASFDFSLVDFTTDGAWHDLDLSAFIPVGTVGITFKLAIIDNLVNAWTLWRTKGNANDFNTSLLRTQVANLDVDMDCILAVDGDRKIQYRTANTAFTLINFGIKGWWIPA